MHVKNINKNPSAKTLKPKAVNGYRICVDILTWGKIGRQFRLLLPL